MRIYTTLALLLATAVLSSAAPASAADAPIESLLPADTQMAMIVRDFPTLREKWAKHPIARTLDDEEVRKFFAPMFEEMEFEELNKKALDELGMSLDEVLDTMQGSMVVAITDFTKIPDVVGGDLVEFDADGDPVNADPATSTQPMPLVMIADIGDDRAKIEQMIAKGRKAEAERLAESGYESRERVERMGKHELHLQSVSKDGESTDTEGWAIVGKRMIVGGTHDLLRATVKRIDAANAADSLASSANYKEFVKGKPNADALVFVNVQAIVGTVMAQWEAEQAAEAKARADAGDDAPPAEDNPFDVTPQRVITALGVDTMRGAGATLSITDEHTDLDAVVHYTERKGLMKVLAFTDGPVDLPKVIPANAITAGASNFSVNQMWTELWNVFTGVSPMLAMMGGQGVAAMNQEMGIDLHNDLIKPIGGHMLTATFFRPPAKPNEAPSIERTDTLYMFALADAAKFKATIEKLRAKMEQDALIEQAGADPDAADDEFAVPQPTFKKRQYLGVTIHEVTTPSFLEDEEPTVMAYAITDKYAMIAEGSAAPIETVLVNQKQGIQSVWEKPAVTAALKDLPANPSAVGYTDLKSVAGSIVALAKQMATLGVAGDVPFDPEADIDPAKLGKHLGPAIGAVYADDKHMAYKFRMVHDNSK